MIDVYLKIVIKSNPNLVNSILGERFQRMYVLITQVFIAVFTVGTIHIKRAYIFSIVITHVKWDDYFNLIFSLNQVTF